MTTNPQFIPIRPVQRCGPGHEPPTTDDGSSKDPGRYFFVPRQGVEFSQVDEAEAVRSSEWSWRIWRPSPSAVRRRRSADRSDVGEAANWRSCKVGERAIPPFGTRARAARNRDVSSDGFTLIELVVVVAVLPLVVGALTVGILSVFTLQSSVSNRLGDSGDAQVVSVNFQSDVQSASMITTASSPSAPAPCGSGFQVLGLQLGNQDQISYNTSANPGGHSATLTRYVCAAGTSTPKSSLVVAHDMPTTALSVSPVTITCPSGSTAPACAPVGGSPPLGVQCVVTGPPGACAYTQGWVSTLGVTKVTFNTTTPNNYNYQLAAVPAAGSNTVSPTHLRVRRIKLASPRPAPATPCWVSWTFRRGTRCIPLLLPTATARAGSCTCRPVSPTRPSHCPFA